MNCGVWGFQELLSYAAPLLADAERIAIASNPLHGLKLRIYLTCEDKLLRHRFIPSQDFQLGEWGLLRMLTAIVGTFDLLRVLSRDFTKIGGLDCNSLDFGSFSY